MDTASLILLLGTIQGFILTIVLFTRKQNRGANRLLSVSIGLISLALLNAYLTTIFDYQEYTFLIKIGDPLFFFFIPFLYLYVKNLTGRLDVGVKTQVVYFIPGFLYVAANIPFYLASSEYKLAYFDRLYLQGIMSSTDMAEEVFAAIVGVVFGTVILRLVLNYRKRIREEFSNLTGITLNWLLFLSSGIFLLIWISVAILIIQLVGVDIPPISQYISAIGSSIFVYIIGYFALSQPQIFSYEYKEKVIEKSNSVQPFADYLERITKHLEEKELFRNASITLNEFSEEVGLPSYLISKTINTELGENFHTFINRYRIEKIKEELGSPENADANIISLAYTFGYSSKSTFNLAFKKFTGTTPSLYKEQLMEPVSVE